MRKKLDVETLLRYLGINAKRERGKTKWAAKCPSPDHPDNSPSWSIVDNEGARNHGSHHCLACGFGGGPWELVAAMRGLSKEEAGALVKSLLTSSGPAIVPKVVIGTRARLREFTLPDGTIIPDSVSQFYPPARTYLNEERRVPDWQIKRWRMGYALTGRLRFRAVIPVYTSGRLRTYSARAFVDGIRRYDAGLEKHGAEPGEAVFGEPKFDPTLDTVTIAEGCFSMLALERACAPNPCAILSSYLTPGRILALSRFKRIIVATDPDAAGDKVMKAILPLGRRVEIVRLRLDKAPDDVPDFQLATAVSNII